ncbi:MAG: putative transcriptional regulator [Candidatus Saccharibacteria bacterium]|nr:putative transcriptional regulator [Candidatus Saccharibacteria bacterium]
MALPINIAELLSGTTVEWERLEFKEGNNPLDTVQTICAFANDINNWGGGYVIIGVAEKNGRPLLPPKGLNLSDIDVIQKEIINLCHQIQPAYFPVIEPVEVEGKTILVIQVPAGEIRPYKAPTSRVKGNGNHRYFIRHGSITKPASPHEERELINASAHVPYDDRVRPDAAINDLKLPLIQAHLSVVGSALLAQSASLSFEELCRKMNIAAGPPEFFRPKNIGLLLFSDDPARFFPCAQIDLVRYQDETGDDFKEKIFTGPIQQQLQDVLVYVKNIVIAERVQKVFGVAEAVRSFNYPFDAIEETLANTIYHRSYEDDSPIEIRIWPNRIEIISYPGPLPPLNKEKLRAGNIVARKYRNRRIGDFLKELHLTEGRGTGILKIKRAMKVNGSPEPLFDTDDELSYFLTVLPIHPDWEVQVGVQVGVQANRGDNAHGVQVGVQVADKSVQVERDILNYCRRPQKRRDILSRIGLLSNQSNYNRYIYPLIEREFLTPTVPDKPNSKNQQYRITPEGEAYFLTLDVQELNREGS